MATVSLKNLTKRYRGTQKPAVEGVSVDVGDHEFLVLLGPSGCGKSTTLRMIAGLETISDGELLIDGQVMNHVPAKNRDIAMVFQSYALYPHMTVRQNLSFGLRRRHFPKREIEKRVVDVAEMLGMGELLDRKPRALSGGQRQRVALGRAITRNPKVFLFDEPLSNLDAALRVTTRNELIKLYQRLRATVIYVTHDQVEAMTMGTRICIINDGHVMQVGKPLEIYSAPRNTFVAGFLGSPPMNLIQVQITRGTAGPEIRVGDALLKTNSSLAIGIGGRNSVILGVRPEDIYLPNDVPSGINYTTLQAKVITVEALGAETLITLAVSGISVEIKARIGRSAKCRPDEMVQVSVSLDAINFFDADTGIRIDTDANGEREVLLYREEHSDAERKPYSK